MPRTIGLAEVSSRVIGVALPLEPNTTRDSGKRTVCWLCPSEWLILCSSADEQSLHDQLRDALRAQFASVVQIGGGQTVFSLQGDSARDLLAQGCPLDLHPRSFSIGQCAQTHVEKVPVLLRPIIGRPRGRRAAQLRRQPLAMARDRRQLTRHRGERSVRVTATSVSKHDRPYGAYAKDPIDR